MEKIVLYLAMSVDGYIADEQGGVDWLGGDGSQPDAPGSYPDFYKTVDAIVMGWSTYHQIVTQLSPGSWPYEGRPCYVVTHRQQANQEGICFWNGELTALMDKLKAEYTGNIWICGGADTAAQLIRKNAIDRYVVSVIPVILGEGIPLFSRGLPQQDLRLVSAAHSNGIAELTYEPR